MSLTHFPWKGWVQPCSFYSFYNGSLCTHWPIASGVISHASVYSTQLDQSFAVTSTFSLSSQHVHNIGLWTKYSLDFTNICASIFSSSSNEHMTVLTLQLAPWAFVRSHRTQLWVVPLLQTGESAGLAGQHRDFKTLLPLFFKARNIPKLPPPGTNYSSPSGSHYW